MLSMIPQVYASPVGATRSGIRRRAGSRRTQKCAGLSVQEVIEVVNALIRISEPVQIRFLWRPLLSDPADDMVLETAVNGRADGLVTFNEADFGPAARKFAFRILRPSEALRRVRAHPDE